MQVVIDIPETYYEYCKAQEDAVEIQLAIKKGTPLPKGHGRLIDADAINLKDISPVDGFSVYGATAEDIDLTPTVLEAESEEL
jgi:hypothetical protein